LKDDPNQLGTEITLIARIALHLSYSDLTTPDFLPAYSPELQPAERLWSLVDEPLVNEYFETIEERSEILITRCQYLETMTNEIKNLTNYHWLTYD
jgi:transposase